MTLYLISGLGVDRRAFQRLRFPAEISMVHLDWIHPMKKESLAAYALRLSKRIDTSEPFGIVGLSFGGMIATEMAKKLNPQHVFLVSSTPTFQGIPGIYRRLGSMGLHKLIPYHMLKWCMPLIFRLFRARQERDKELLRSIIRDTDTKFMKWAVNAILCWRNQTTPSCLYSVHGAEDVILPVQNIHPNLLIPAAGHLMVYTHGDQVAAHILQVINRQ